MNITYYGHSCFGVEIKGRKILFDPFISPNELAKNIRVETVEADYILISHGHGDHVADAVAIAQRTNAKVICNYEIGLWLEKKNVKNIHSMNIGGKVKLDFGNIKCVAAQHSSGLPDGTYGGNPMGFVIESSEGNFYYAGDTALTYDMKLIGDYRKIDFAFLPIGDNYTMGVDNAIIACNFIQCNQIIGMHYDTFESIKIDKLETLAKFERAGKKLTLMKIGETRATQDLN
ncbi:metal-dependent hydrolase [Aurantibacillus circumpalustris]|uniref:metal-dependent hydrolase n=1 Tax=Aurantibacillus circumpalustris TaxID=3036359 RepID=UPI00295B59DE|nr:metal-dependent hydrolase [Aurantibacillus circumpalustris]